MSSASTAAKTMWLFIGMYVARSFDPKLLGQRRYLRRTLLRHFPHGLVRRGTQVGRMLTSDEIFRMIFPPKTRAPAYHPPGFTSL